jgi:hypothetical protein
MIAPLRPANVCSGCGRDFGSVTAFDRHRVGRYAYSADRDHPDGRRCLTGNELAALGMTLDRLGRWRLPVRGKPPWSRDVSAESREAGEGSGGTTPREDSASYHRSERPLRSGERRSKPDRASERQRRSAGGRRLLRAGDSRARRSAGGGGA